MQYENHYKRLILTTFASVKVCLQRIYILCPKINILTILAWKLKMTKWDICGDFPLQCSAFIWWIFATAYSEAALLILILKMLLANKRVASILDDMETFSWYCFKMQIRLPFSLLLLLSSKASEKEEKKSRQDKGEKSFFFYILSC